MSQGGEGSSSGGGGGGGAAYVHPPQRPKDLYGDNEDLPLSVDWRVRQVHGKQIIVSPVRDKKKLPTCAYHAVSTCMEAACNIKYAAHSNSVALSVQELIDWVKPNLTTDDTIRVSTVLNHVSRFGLVPEGKYKYIGKQGIHQKRDATLDLQARRITDNWDVKEKMDEKEVLKLVFEKPVIGVLEYTEALHLWKGKDPEIFQGTSLVVRPATPKGKEGETTINIPTHAVLIVGYGTTDDKAKTNYWIVRNSRSENWGDGGYCKIARACSRHDRSSLFFSIGICEAA